MTSAFVVLETRQRKNDDARLALACRSALAFCAVRISMNRAMGSVTRGANEGLRSRLASSKSSSFAARWR